MFSVNGGQILLTAGDTGLLAVIPDEEGYMPTQKDRAIFTVRERAGRRTVIEKTLTPEEDGRVLLRFAHEDTEKLAQAEYAWDIRFALDAAVDGEGKVTDFSERITPCAPGTLLILGAIGEV